MRVLVLGAYGLIGGEIVRTLIAGDFRVTGLARDAAKGRRFMPSINWIGADLAKLKAPDSWAEHLVGVDAVVNASGALQDGRRDDLKATQEVSIKACISACEKFGVKSFVQISAPGAVANASTKFLQTKAAADEALRASQLDWIIFKPGLVISANAYGGTALLRMLAGFPFVQPLVMGSARMQTVYVGDVARAIVVALRGEAPLHETYDLIEDQAHSLRGIVKGFRRWLGFPEARLLLEAPDWLGFLIARGADIAGRLGWRSPLRTTALRVLSEDVVGDPEKWKRATGRSLKGFDESLATIPSTVQERIFARQQLAFPMMLMVLAVFWVASGVIGLIRLEDAAAILPEGFSRALACWLVLAGSITDLAIGAGLLYRPAWKAAAVGSILLSLAYLLSGAVLTPELWLDPLGPFVKVIPCIALAASVLMLGEER